VAGPAIPIAIVSYVRLTVLTGLELLCDRLNRDWRFFCGAQRTFCIVVYYCVDWITALNPISERFRLQNLCERGRAESAQVASRRRLSSLCRTGRDGGLRLEMPVGKDGPVVLNIDLRSRIWNAR